MKYLDEYREPGIVSVLREKISTCPFPIKVMEVCGTHTVSIARSGIKDLVTPHIELVSGPGCPVCVTSDRDVDRIIALSDMPDTIIATFGDMMRVPGSCGSLAAARARGALIEVIYSPLEALRIASENPSFRVVLIAVGFETTAPTVAATVIRAREEGISNFYVLSLHKLVPPALKALVSMEDFSVSAFILPGHVSAIIGSEPYEFLAVEHGIPCVIAGFEPVDIMYAFLKIVDMVKGDARVEIGYTRAVRPEGNRKAVEIMNSVFELADAQWRGLSTIEKSGLRLRSEYRYMDASEWVRDVCEPPLRTGCRCGEVLCGKISPPQCALFGRECTPDEPVGPCMVSSEGTCAAYFTYL